MEILRKLGTNKKCERRAIPGDLPKGRPETISLGVKENPAYAMWKHGPVSEYSPVMKMHGPVVGIPALWFAMLRPLIGLIIGFLGFWVVG